jgi:DNA repair protein RecO (recombination protein O)
MALYKAEGVVLRSRAWGEADRIVTLLSPQHGKIPAIAKGARRPRNRLAAGTQLFSYIDILAAAGASLDSISQCEIIDSFRDLRDDLDKMTYGAYIAEMVDELIPEHEPDEELFALVLDLFNLLRCRNPRIVVVIAALKLFSRAGYRPQVGSCVQCNRRSGLADDILFSASLGGMLCGNCRAADPAALPVAPATMDWFEQLSKIDLSAPEKFSLPAAVLKELEDLLRQYTQHCLEKELKSAQFLTSLRD